MKFKSIIKGALAAILLTGSFSAFAANKHIECPSVDFLKQYEGTMNYVKRMDAKWFVVESDTMVYDSEHKFYWMLRTENVGTIKDYDFNSANKTAEEDLRNTAIRDTQSIDYPYAACAYADKSDTRTVYLVPTDDSMGIKKIK